MPGKKDFVEELEARFCRAAQRGVRELVVNSGDLHRALGGYPGRDHRMPSCCDVMLQAARPGDEQMSSPAGGKGASLTIRYRLPKP